MIWNDENKRKLELLYNAGRSDENICLLMGGKSAFSIGKARSNFGFVKFKQKQGLKRAAKTVKPPINTNFTVLYYKQEGQDHFAMIGPEANPKPIAQQMLCRTGVSEVFILKPQSKLVMQQVTEVKL